MWLGLLPKLSNATDTIYMYVPKFECRGDTNLRTFHTLTMTVNLMNRHQFSIKYTCHVHYLSNMLLHCCLLCWNVFILKVIDCGDLDPPPNGVVSYFSTTVNSIATYSCNTGYVFNGENATSACMSSGAWSNVTVECKCE